MKTKAKMVIGNGGILTVIFLNDHHNFLWEKELRWNRAWHWVYWAISDCLADYLLANLPFIRKVRPWLEL